MPAIEANDLPLPAAQAGTCQLVPGLITTHAESKRRLPGTATAPARQSHALLTFLRGQPDRIKGYAGRSTMQQAVWGAAGGNGTTRRILAPTGGTAAEIVAVRMVL